MSPSSSLRLRAPGTSPGFGDHAAPGSSSAFPGPALAEPRLSNPVVVPTLVRIGHTTFMPIHGTPPTHPDETPGQPQDGTPNRARHDPPRKLTQNPTSAGNGRCGHPLFSPLCRVVGSPRPEAEVTHVEFSGNSFSAESLEFSWKRALGGPSRQSANDAQILAAQRFKRTGCACSRKGRKCGQKIFLRPS